MATWKLSVRFCSHLKGMHPRVGSGVEIQLDPAEAGCPGQVCLCRNPETQLVKQCGKEEIETRLLVWRADV